MIADNHHSKCQIHQWLRCPIRSNSIKNLSYYKTMKISTEKFLKSSSSRNLNWYQILNSTPNWVEIEWCWCKHLKVVAENIQLLGRTKSSLEDSQNFINEVCLRVINKVFWKDRNIRKVIWTTTKSFRCFIKKN